MVFEESEPESITIEQALAAVKSMKESGEELNANINSRRDSAESLKKLIKAMANHARSHGVLINWAVQALARIESERAAQDEFNVRVERALDMLRGPRESYRPILTDKDKILARICSYAKRTAAGDDERRSVPVWSVVSDITGHGSGVSSAIYELYRERDEEEVKAKSEAKGGAS